MQNSHNQNYKSIFNPYLHDNSQKMRRRSNTIYAENLDQYLNSAKISTSYKCSPLHISQKRQTPTKKPKEEDYDPFGCDLFSCSDDSAAKKIPVKVKHPIKKISNPREESSLEWSDFDFNTEEKHIDGENPPRTSSMTLSDNTAAETDESDDDEGIVQGMENSILRKIMVIGLEDIGKRLLINNVFDCGENLADYKENPRVLDLLTKTEEDLEYKVPVRYQFWMRNLKEEEGMNRRFEDQIKVYYKNVSLFIFVYKVSDQSSFDAVERAVEVISRDIQPENFMAVLVGMDDLKQERKISYFDGISLQEKYPFTFFIETNVKDIGLKEKLLQVMRDNEGLGELKNEKLLSITSLD